MQMVENLAVSLIPELIRWLGSIVAAMLVLAWPIHQWLAKQASRAVSHAFDTRLASHVEELKSASAKELERLRSELSLEVMRQQALHSELMRYRFEAIAAIVSPLRKFQRVVADYTNVMGEVGGDARKDRRVAVEQAQSELLAVLEKQAIFLDANSADRVEKIRLECAKAARLFHHFVEIANDSPNGADIDQWFKVTEAIDGDVPLAIRMLEMQLRVIMGDRPNPEDVKTGPTVKSEMEGTVSYDGPTELA